MQTSPGPWIAALRNSHDRLQAVAGPLGAGQAQQHSYCSDWSIAQVLSHLGSQAEIFGLWLNAGLTGEDPPGNESFPPIWDRWNAKSPQDQVTDGLTGDEVVTARFESLDEQQRGQFRLKMFGMDLDCAGIARMRLSEHAVHTWDVAVAVDPAATLADDAAALLIDAAGQAAGRSGKTGGPERQLRVTTSDPERHFILRTGETVSLADDPDSGGSADLSLPAEAFIRLLYGRLDPAHTPAVEDPAGSLAGLRQVFTGF